MAELKKKPSRSPPAAKEPAVVPAADLKRLARDLKRAEIQLEQCEQDHKSEMERLRDQLDESQKETEQALTQREELTQKLHKLQQQQMEKDETKRKVMKQMNKLKETHAQLQREHTALNDKFSNASGQLEKRSSNSRDLREAKTKLTQLKRSMKETREKLEDEHSNAIEQLEHSRNSLRAENGILSKRVEYLEDQILQQANRPSKRESQAQTLQKELNNMIATNESLEHVCAEANFQENLTLDILGDRTAAAQMERKGGHAPRRY